MRTLHLENKRNFFKEWVSFPLVHKKTFLAYFWVEHHVIRKEGRIGKDQAVNF